MRDRGKVAFACTDRNFVREWGDENPERSANRYAAGLLLPPKLFKAAARSRVPTFSSVGELSKIFRVSRTATAIRLIELGDMPAMIVCHDQATRLWSGRSSTVPSTLWTLPRPGSGSVASRLLADPSMPEPGPTLVDADEWIDKADAARYSLTEDSVRAGMGMVLTLLWWKDEAQILDEESDDEGAEPGHGGPFTFGRRGRR
jgi:hypothetical protein